MTDSARRGQFMTMPGDTRRKLDVEGARSGASAKLQPEFEHVFHEHYGFVWRALLHMGVPESSADDAAQDVFVVVHRRFADFDGRGDIRSWLWGIARRVARDHRRSAFRARRRLSVVRPPKPEPAPDEQVERREVIALVEECLADLSEAQREVFVLVEIEEMTAPEVAGALGVKLNTVYSRLRAARARFKKVFARRRVREERRR